MMVLARRIREYHPLHHLRKIKVFGVLTQRFDIPVWINICGIRHRVRVRLMRHLSYLLNRRPPEPEIFALFVAVSKLFKPRPFWDIGANIGLYSYLLKSHNGEIAVIMFEPDPANTELINQTICSGGIQMKVFPYAVSDGEDEGIFALDSVSGATGTLENPGESFSAKHYGVVPKQIRVRKVTIDSIRMREKPVDMIKIDVEGHETEILEGLQGALEAGRVSALMIDGFKDRSIPEKLTPLGSKLFEGRSLRPYNDQFNLLGVHSSEIR